MFVAVSLHTKTSKCWSCIDWLGGQQAMCDERLIVRSVVVAVTALVHSSNTIEL